MAKKSKSDNRTKIVAEFSIYGNDIVQDMFTKALSFANIVAGAAEDLAVNASKTEVAKRFDDAHELFDTLYTAAEDSKANNSVITLAVWMLATSLVLSKEEADGSDITKSTSVTIIDPTKL